jgi:hypothetical protein
LLNCREKEIPNFHWHIVTNSFTAIGNNTNYLPKRAIEGKRERRIEVAGRRGRRHKQLPDELKIKREEWRLEEEALDRTLWIIRFGRGYRPVERQATEWLNEWMKERMWFGNTGVICVRYYLFLGFLDVFICNELIGIYQITLRVSPREKGWKTLSYNIVFNY